MNEGEPSCYRKVRRPGRRPQDTISAYSTAYLYINNSSKALVVYFRVLQIGTQVMFIKKFEKQ